MIYYHCSPISGITVLEPRCSIHSSGTKVCLTSLLPMALMYGIKNFDYTYGFTREKEIYFEEYFPDSLRILYDNKSASLYICKPSEVSDGRIPFEYVSAQPVPVTEEIHIPNLYEALLEQEKLGGIRLYKYSQLTPERRESNTKMIIREILNNNLLTTPGAHADYIKLHYPDAWAAAKEL